MRKHIVFLLVAVLILGSMPALAGGNMELPQPQSSDNGSRDALIKGSIVLAVAGGVFLVGRHFYRQSRAGNYYQRAREYAERGQWDRAVDYYLKALDVVSDYQDAERRLREARNEAESMFIARGDEARDEERYQQAMEYYQQAVSYNPDSFRAQNRLDELGKKIVEVHYRRGYTYEVQNRWEDAYDEYRLAYSYDRDYQDLADRYFRARARVQDELPLRALIFIINRTGEVGLERPFLHALQSQLENVISDDFYMMERQQVQQVMDEQAEALSDTRDRELALDLGRILGAEEVLVGEITEIYSSFGRLRMDIELEVIGVDSGSRVEEIDYTHAFDRGVESGEIIDLIDRVAKELVESEF